MSHAPEMSPTLDDALRALDGARVNGVISATQLAAVRGFLDQLDDVRACPAVLPSPAQAVALEGAYQAGVRCADESGHVLVVSLPALLAWMGQEAPAPGAWRPVSEPRRDGLLAPFGRLVDWFVGRPLVFAAGALVLAALVAQLADHDGTAAGCLLLVALGILGMDHAVHGLPPSRCTYDCNGGRACTCPPRADTCPISGRPVDYLRAWAPAPGPSRCTYPECVCSFEQMVAGCKSHRKEAKHAG